MNTTALGSQNSRYVALAILVVILAAFAALFAHHDAQNSSPQSHSVALFCTRC